MTPLSSLIQKPTLPMLLIVAQLAGCSGDEGTGPSPPEAGTLPATGQIVVSVTSDRSEFELSFTIDGAGTWTLRPNDDVRVGGLMPGQYRVTLTVPAAVFACQVRDGNQRTAVVRAGVTTSVQYHIDCGPLPDWPRERKREVR